MINQKKKGSWTRKIKLNVQEKIESLKDDNQVKILSSENEKLIHSDSKKLTKRLMRSQIINDGKRGWWERAWWG